MVRKASVIYVSKKSYCRRQGYGNLLCSQYNRTCMIEKTPREVPKRSNTENLPLSYRNLIWNHMLLHGQARLCCTSDFKGHCRNPHNGSRANSLYATGKYIRFLYTTGPTCHRHQKYTYMTLNGTQGIGIKSDVISGIFLWI
jgi:hypothetical protein